eukprot:scaffold1720_cov238-Pinguiococcus_pyrenoidosus.AAC.7
MGGGCGEMDRVTATTPPDPSKALPIPGGATGVCCGEVSCIRSGGVASPPARCLARRRRSLEVVTAAPAQLVSTLRAEAAPVVICDRNPAHVLHTSETSQRADRQRRHGSRVGAWAERNSGAKLACPARPISSQRKLGAGHLKSGQLHSTRAEFCASTRSFAATEGPLSATALSRPISPRLCMPRHLKRALQSPFTDCGVRSTRISGAMDFSRPRVRSGGGRQLPWPASPSGCDAPGRISPRYKPEPSIS